MATAHSPHALETANYLRSKDAKLKVKEGILDGRRVEIFKGKSALKSLRLPAYANSKRTAVNSSEEAAELLGRLLQEGIFARVEKTKSRHYRLVHPQTFGAEEYFVWVYQGSQWRTYLIGSGLIAITLAGVMFPLWPVQLRTGVWYLSVSLLSLLGVFFGMVLVRVLLYIATVLIYRGRGLWIFPNLFEDVGILESFQPYFEWEPTKEEKIAKGGAGSDDEGDDGGEEEEEAIEGVSEGANDGRPTSQSETDSPSGSIRKRKGK